MIRTDVFRAVRDSVCAIAVSTTCKFWNYSEHEQKPDSFEWLILGTGFLATNTLVLTNRHVWEAMSQYNQDHVALVFIGARHDANIYKSFQKIERRIILSSSPDFNKKPDLGMDLAFLEVNASSAKDIAHYHRPVTFATKDQIQIGDHIGVCGYIFGAEMFGIPDDLSTLRNAPLLLQGHIAGVAPYDNIPGLPVKLILTDLTTGGGLSGSPVFIEDGRVIGVHSAGRAATVLGPGSSPSEPLRVASITQGIGYAVPVTEEFMAKLTARWDEICLAAEELRSNDTRIVPPRRSRPT